ncbi:MAG: SDR family NAD(P)-dependent oxidoreductase [Acidimicrobiia bacterium]
MTDKAAIVTGASRGIGKQIAIALAEQGYDIVVAARTVEPHRRLPGTIGETVSAVESTGRRALAVRVDMTNPDDITALVSATIDRFGRLDVLVNNAADTSGGTPTLADLEMGDWLRQFDANLHGPLRLMQAALPHLVASGAGIIVNMTSGAAELVPVSAASGETSVLGGERLAYAASKAALNRLANALSPELRRQNVAIVNVDPGYTRTELVDLMAERGYVDPSGAVPMEVPVKTVVDLVTGRAMEHTGQILQASIYVDTHHL